MLSLALTSSWQPLCRLPGLPSRPGHLSPNHPPSHPSLCQASVSSGHFTTWEEEPLAGGGVTSCLPPASLPAPTSQLLGRVLAAPSSMRGAVSWEPLSAVNTDQTWHQKAAPSGGRAPQACGPHWS